MNIYLEYHSVCPFVRNVTSPPPVPQASVSPQEPKEEGKLSPTGEGVVGSQIWRLEKKPSTLSTLSASVAYQGRTPLCWQGCGGPSISPPWPQSPPVHTENPEAGVLKKLRLANLSRLRYSWLRFDLATPGYRGIVVHDRLVYTHCKSRPSQYELHISWKELYLFAWGRQSSKLVW
jgi:hypothetical protein